MQKIIEAAVGLLTGGLLIALAGATLIGLAAGWGWRVFRWTVGW